MFIHEHHPWCADVARAKEVGECISLFVDKQPDLNQHFLLRMAGSTGELVTKFPDDQANFYRLSRTEKNQLHFLLGYPVFFLYFLRQATGEDKYIQTAEKILSFVLKCDESMYTFFLSHKAAFGAGLVSKATGKVDYKDLCQRIVSHLLTLQTSEGDFVKDLPLLARLDQSAEIAVWLRELANHLCL